MKNRVIIPLLLVAILVGSATSEDALDLHQAVKSGQVGMVSRSSGEYQGEAVVIEIENRTDRTQKLLLPAGTLFKADSEPDQDIIVVQEQYIALGPRERSTWMVRGYCSQMDDSSPEEGSQFTMVMTEREDLKKLIEKCKGINYDDEMLQQAVWSVTDLEPVSSIYSDEPSESTALRQAVAEITGLENPWYQTRNRYSVAEDRSIQMDPVEVSGEIHYKSKKGEIIAAELWGPGNEKIAALGDGRRSPVDGNMHFTFKLKIEGYPKGIYLVRVLGNNNVISESKFEV